MSQEKQQMWLVVGLTLGLGVLGLDQGIKNLAHDTVINEGPALSVPVYKSLLTPLFSPAELMLFLTGGVIVLVAGLGWWHIRRHTHQRLSICFFISYGLLLGAAISNWWDRLIFGGVRDVWRLDRVWWIPQGLTNNLADYVIVASLLIIVTVDIYLSTLGNGGLDRISANRSRDRDSG
jgi:lipoprotein signal peptidase